MKLKEYGSQGVFIPCAPLRSTTAIVCWDSWDTPPAQLHSGIHTPWTDRCKNISLPQTSFAGSNQCYQSINGVQIFLRKVVNWIS